MRKIMIFYASYGGGHLSAARSIKENIEANYKDVEVMLVDCMYYVNKFFDKVTTTAYSEMAKKIPQTWGKVYWHAQSGPIAQISTTSNKLLSKKLNTLLKNFNPELIISTHPFASTMCAYLKKQGKLNAKIATVLTDYAPHDQWIVFNEYVDYYFVSHDITRLLFTRCATSNASRHFKSPLAMGRDAFKPKHASSVSISKVIDTGVNSNPVFSV